jgi:hypothetical protein
MRADSVAWAGALALAAAGAALAAGSETRTIDGGAEALELETSSMMKVVLS